MMAMVGYGHQGMFKSQLLAILNIEKSFLHIVFTFRHEYWIWCPVMAPILGALVGTGLYDTFFFVGGESIVNTPDARARAAHEHARNLEKHKLATGEGVEGVTGPALV